MRKLLLLFVFLLLFQIDVHATMYKYDPDGSISNNNIDVHTPTVIIYNPSYVSGISNINNDGYWESEHTVSDSNARPVPEPATMLLFGSGLIALGWISRKKLFKGNSL